MTISRFVSLNSVSTYTFPTSPGDQDFVTDFKRMKTKVTKGIGTNGGVDEYGTGASPHDGESVQFSVYLVSTTRAGMQPLRDALNVICEWGVGRLYDTLNGVDRWCYARISVDDIKEDRSKNTDLQQKVQLTFQVSDPFWYTAGTEAVWGGSTWGGTIWGGSGSPTTITNAGTMTVTNNGSAYTVPRIVLWNNSGSTIYSPRIQRIVNGSVVDELSYSGSIADGTQVDINARQHRASITGVTVTNNLVFQHPDWMRLLPGSNTLQINLTGVVKVLVHYFERYT